MKKTRHLPALRFKDENGKEFPEWNELLLRNICQINPPTEKPLPPSFTYIDLECVKSGRLGNPTVLRRTNAPSRAQRILEKGDVLFQTVRPYQKNNYFFDLDGNFVASTGYTQIRIEEHLPRFVFHMLHRESFVNIVISRSTGTSYSAVSSHDLRSIKVRIPTMGEQQKIADFLSAMDKRIELLERKKSLLGEFKRGLMQQLFNRELRFKDENGREFPEWESTRLGQASEILMGTSPNSTAYNNDKDGLPLIQGNTDIRNRISHPRRYTSHITKVCIPSDVLISVRAPVGEVAQSVHNACIGRGIAALRANISGVMTQSYLYYQCLWLERRWKKYSQGSTFEAVNSNDIRVIPIFLPTVKEQQKIADFLSAVDEKIELLSQQITQAQTFKKGLMQQLFV